MKNPANHSEATESDLFRKKAAAMAKAVAKLEKRRLAETSPGVASIADAFWVRPAAVLSAHRKCCDEDTYPNLKEPNWTTGEVLAPLQPEAIQRMYKAAGKGSWATKSAVDALYPDEDTFLFRKQQECYLDGSGDLGPYFRWLVVLQLYAENGGSEGRGSSGGRLPSFADDSEPAPLTDGADVDVAFKAANGAAGSTGALRKHFALAFHFGVNNQCTKAIQYTRPERWSEPLLEFLRQLRVTNGAKPIELGDLFSVKVAHTGEKVGLGVLGRFRVWLQHGWLPARDDLSRLHCEVFLAGDLPSGGVSSARRKQLDGVLSALLEDGPAVGGHLLSGTYPVLSVVSPKNWHGMRAFATKLCIELKQRQSSRNKPYGIVYVPLSRGITEGNRRLTRADVTNLLHSAFGLAQRGVDEENSNDNLSQLAQVRAELTKRRTLIIFDGLETSAQPFDAAFEVLKHTDWPTYIRTLLQPDPDQLVAMGGEYPSRFLVLSGQPVGVLRPWIASRAGAPDDEGVPVRLEPPPHSLQALSLIKAKDRAVIDAWLDPVRAVCKQLWSPEDGPNTSDNGLSLMNLYQLRPETVDKIEAAADPVRLPDELDLATLWCEQQMGEVDLYALRQAPQEGQLAAERRLRVFRNFLKSEHSSPGEALALQFISVALKGLRVTTLRRCLRAFLEEHQEDEAVRQSIHKVLNQLSESNGAKAFAEKYHPLLVLSVDEELEGISSLQRWFDLQPMHKVHDDRNHASNSALLDIRLVELRELLLDVLLNAHTSSTASEQARQRRNFEAVSRILSEEALAEATVQLRGLKSGSEVNAYTMRRLVQAIYHGLMSISFESDWDLRETSSGQRPADVRGAHLPENPYKRFVYLYEFVFRKCIDNAPEWLLGRGVGRFDVRLALLTMFVNPGWTRRVLASLYKRPLHERSFEHFGAFLLHDGMTEIGQFRSPLDPTAPQLRGALGIDLFKALLHCASRTGRHAFVSGSSESLGNALTEVAAARQTPSVPSSKQAPNILLDRTFAALDSLRAVLQQESGPSNAILDERFAFAKLAIDAKQALVQTSAAEDSCLRWLEAFGTKGDAELLSLGRDFDTANMDKAEFETKFLQPRVDKILGSGISKKELIFIGDIYFRLGELLATSADRLELQTHQQLAIEYAHAYAAYWVGDRVRSGAATSDLDNVEWPAISARAMRYYVRVSLKLAKLSARIHRATSADASRPECLALNASAFFAHARGRIDVYSRHLYRLPVERLSMQLLLASAARVWASISRLLIEVSGDQERLFLEASVSYLNVAEGLLGSLGYIETKTRRLLFERVKTMRRLSELGGSGSAAFGKIMTRDLEVLRRLSAGHLFWQELVSRIDKPFPSRAGLAS